jgi:hypothetical protein
MIQVTDHHGARLLRITPAVVRPALAEELEYGARIIADSAIASIKDGGISGPGHVASAPGEAPNADTGALDQSIRPIDTIELPGEVRSGVIADSDHAWIERGGSNMEPRPYIEPSVELHRSDILHALHERFRELMGS